MRFKLNLINLHFSRKIMYCFIFKFNRLRNGKSVIERENIDVCMFI